MRRAAAGPSRTSSDRVLRTPVLQRAVRSAAVCVAATALVRYLPRRMRSDGLETVKARTSRGTTEQEKMPDSTARNVAHRAKTQARDVYHALVVPPARLRTGSRRTMAAGFKPRCSPWIELAGSLRHVRSSDSDGGTAPSIGRRSARGRVSLRWCVLNPILLLYHSQRGLYSALRPRDRHAGGRCPSNTSRVRLRRKKRGPKTKKGRNLSP